MGIILSNLHLLAIENKNYPIRGDVLTLGQQALYGTVEEVEHIFTSHGLKLKPLKQGFDTKSKIPMCVGTPRGEFTNAQAVFSLLGADSVFASDVSDYENPDYIIDLNSSVDQKYYEKFDVLFDSGTLEHVFDVPTALGNYVKMVKKGGRVIILVPCSNTINHGFYSFNPNLFYDFFSANGFSDFSCYLIEESSFNPYHKSKIYKFNYNSKLIEYPLYSKHMTEVCFCATKKGDIDLQNIKKPIQGMYLEYQWGRKKGQETVSQNQTIYKKIRGKLGEYKRKFEFSTRKFRPEFIDILFQNKRRRKNVTYLGKF